MLLYTHAHTHVHIKLVILCAFDQACSLDCLRAVALRKRHASTFDRMFDHPLFLLVAIVQLPVALQIGRAGKLLQTHVARVRLFARMRAVVQLEAARIVEHLRARAAPVRILVAMDTLVRLQRAGVVERFRADITLVRLFPGVGEHVLPQGGRFTVALVAHVALMLQLLLLLSICVAPNEARSTVSPSVVRSNG